MADCVEMIVSVVEGFAVLDADVNVNIVVPIVDELLFSVTTIFVLLTSFFSLGIDDSFFAIFVVTTGRVRLFVLVDGDSVTRVMKFSFLIAVLLDTTKRLRVVRMDVETVVISFVSVGPEAKSNLISL